MGIFNSKEEKQVKMDEKRENKLKIIEKLFTKSLLDGETFVDFLIGYNDNVLISCYFVLTNKRLIFREGFSEKAVETKNIISVEQKLISLEVKGSNFETKIKCVRYGNIPQMVQNINMAKDQVSFPSIAIQSPDNFEQIVKLKSLLDDGILTQEEFDLKKKQLLGL